MATDGPSFTLEQRLEVLRRADVPAPAAHVLACLLFRFSYHGDGDPQVRNAPERVGLTCWPSLPEQARVTKLHVSSVQRNVGKLAQAGVIEIRRPRGFRAHRPNVYALLLAPDGGPPPEAPAPATRAPTAAPVPPGLRTPLHGQAPPRPEKWRDPRHAPDDWPVLTCRGCGGRGAVPPDSPPMRTGYCKPCRAERDDLDGA